MPKRTNRFQRLVLALNELLGPDADVQESREFIDSVTGHKREVDVCIETESNGHKMIVGVECRDHKAKQGVTWVEAERAKHEFIPVNKTVLVSKSGFWSTAETKARIHDIDLISMAPDESVSLFIGDIVNKLEVVFAKRIEYRPDTVRVLLQMASGATDEVVVKLEQGGNAPALHRADGSQAVLQGKVPPEATVAHLPQLALAQIKHDDPTVRDAVEGEFKLDFNGGPNPRLNGELLYLVPDPEHGDVPEPAQITHMWVSGRATVNVIEVALTHGDYNGTSYSTGAVELPDGTFQLVAIEKDDAPAQWTMVQAPKE